jgi:hypothetical protein
MNAYSKDLRTRCSPPSTGHRLRGGLAPVQGIFGDDRALREAQEGNRGGGAEVLAGQDAAHL